MTALKLEEITVDYVKNNYILPFGSTNDATDPLSDGAGNDVGDAFIQTHINGSIAEAEALLGVFLSKKTVITYPALRGIVSYDVEGRPMQYNWRNVYKEFPQLWLPHTNLISIDRIAVWFGKQEVSTIPNDWISIVAPKEGRIAIVPLGGGAVIITANVLYGLTAKNSVYQDTVPGFWVCDYKCGIENLTQDIVDFIGFRTAVFVLGITAMAKYQGVSSETLSIDGMSQSSSSIATGMYSRYGDLQTLFNSVLKDFSKKRIRYRGMRVGSV